MASISLLTFLISSVLYLAHVFSVMPFIDDIRMIGRSNQFSSSMGIPEFAKLLVNLQRIAGSIISVVTTFLLFNHLSFLLLNTTTIIISVTLAHSGQKEPACKYLFKTVIKSLKRPFLTSVLVSMLAHGYLVILTPILLSFASSSPFFFTTIFAYLLYIYLSMVWRMALVVSVLEEVNGLEALGKAAGCSRG